MRRRADLAFARVKAEQAGHPVHVRARQHVGLRNHQAVNRVVRYRVPVDELVDYIRVGPEWEHRGHRADREPVGVAKAGALDEHVQVPRSVGPKSASGFARPRQHLLDVRQPSSPSVRWRPRGPAETVLNIPLQLPRILLCDLPSH